MSYQQLTQEQRYHIAALMKAGYNQTDIATEIGVDKSTPAQRAPARELQRNSGQRGYRPKQAHALALSRQRDRARTPRIAVQTWELVETHLRQEWSPEQVSGWLRQKHQLRVSHERIYQYVYDDKWAGGTLHQHLRCGCPLGKSSAASATAAMTAVVHSPTAAASVNALPLSSSGVA